MEFPSRPQAAHRLDQGTSGLIVLGRTKSFLKTFGKTQVIHILLPYSFLTLLTKCWHCWPLHNRLFPWLMNGDATTLVLKRFKTKGLGTIKTWAFFWNESSVTQCALRLHCKYCTLCKHTCCSKQNSMFIILWVWIITDDAWVFVG